MNHPILGAGIPPALIFIIGALFIPLLRGRVKKGWMLILPVFAFYTLVCAPVGKYWIFSLFDYSLILGRVDRLSLAFGYIFTIISFAGAVFALHLDDDAQHVSGFMYAGGALGVTFAGDFFSLYIFWELMAIASTFLILARRTKRSGDAAFRYVMVHIFGGLCLLAGIVMKIYQTGSTEFAFIGLGNFSSDAASAFASWLIFIGIAVNAAMPPIHPWLKDAYPEATVTGAVFLSAFTTKSAVYMMARTFPGTEILIVLGAVMAVYPIIYAVLENDVRRVLAYSLINQVGFMMCGVGIGTPLALNGTVAHAFCHILYKALLFMCAGAVLERTGRIKCTDLGGLYRTMPLTCLFCLVGTASIAAFPFFNGFISKSMIVSAAAHKHLVVTWFALQFASACIFHYLKVPYFMFFSSDSGLRPKEAPVNMLIAMGALSFLCLFLGCYPKPLYGILPYAVDYVPYTGAHVIGKLQLLMFGSFAFCILLVKGLYPAELRAVNLDTDWFYRKGAKGFAFAADKVLNGINAFCDRFFALGMSSVIGRFCRNAPQRMALLIVSPVLFLTGVNEVRAESIRQKLSAAFRTGSVPIGISAAAGTLSIIVLFLLI